MVRAIRNGWIKPPSEKEAEKTRYHDIWATSDSVSDSTVGKILTLLLQVVPKRGMCTCTLSSCLLPQSLFVADSTYLADHVINNFVHLQVRDCTIKPSRSSSKHTQDILGLHVVSCSLRTRMRTPYTHTRAHPHARAHTHTHTHKVSTLKCGSIPAHIVYHSVPSFGILCTFNLPNC